MPLVFVVWKVARIQKLKLIGELFNAACLQHCNHHITYDLLATTYVGKKLELMK
jgi:hypothetical protein